LAMISPSGQSGAQACTCIELKSQSRELNITAALVSTGPGRKCVNKSLRVR
jgi:hypothetical protein